MRGRGIFAAVALAAIGAFGAISYAPAGGAQAVMPRDSRKVTRAERRHYAVRPDVAPFYRRSKNLPQRRRLRANRMIISRRVRRRHRRGRG